MSKELKGKLLELFKKIEHGDYEHRKWLYDEMLKFQEENKFSLVGIGDEYEDEEEVLKVTEINAELSGDFSGIGITQAYKNTFKSLRKKLDKWQEDNPPHDGLYSTCI